MRSQIGVCGLLALVTAAGLAGPGRDPWGSGPVGAADGPGTGRFGLGGVGTGRLDLGPAGTGQVSYRPAEPAPTAPVGTPAGAVVPGSYVVVYREGARPGAGVAAFASRATFRYGSALHGFAARLDAGQLAAVRADPAVAAVVPDVVVRAVDTVPQPYPDATPTGASAPVGTGSRTGTGDGRGASAGTAPAATPAAGTVRAAATTRFPVSWGQDRIDQARLPLDNSFTPAGDGSGVTVYVLDTGVRSGHVELRGRVDTGINFAPHTAPGHPGTEVDPADTSDCDGHGTHVAGTVAGATAGVAGRATVVPVRVLDCTGSGTLSGVVAGVDWVTAHHATPAVANLSLGAPRSSSTWPLESAVNRSIAAGVVYAVAAGNDSTDACDQSPAVVAAAVTVGASTVRDATAYYSNFGSCVDLYAPGSGILSAWPSSDTAGAVLSGTSMASPHVAGVAALILQAAPGDTPAEVRTALAADAVQGVLSGIITGSGDPNVLLQVPPDTSLTGDVTAPVVSAVTVRVVGSTATATVVATDPSPGPGTPSAPVGSPTTPVRSPARADRDGVAPAGAGTGPAGLRAASPVPGPPISQTGAPDPVNPTPSPTSPAPVVVSGIKGYAAVWDHTPAPAVTTWLSSLDGQLSVRLPDGRWYLHVRVVDRAGNWSQVATVGWSLVDGAPPTIVRIAVARVGSGRFRAVLAGTDAGSGLSGFAVVWNTRRNSAVGRSSFVATSSTAAVTSPRLARGTWYLHVAARDRSGHWSAWATAGPVRSPR